MKSIRNSIRNLTKTKEDILTETIDYLISDSEGYIDFKGIRKMLQDACHLIVNVKIKICIKNFIKGEENLEYALWEDDGHRMEKKILTAYFIVLLVSLIFYSEILYKKIRKVVRYLRYLFPAEVLREALTKFSKLVEDPELKEPVMGEINKIYLNEQMTFDQVESSLRDHQNNAYYVIAIIILNAIFHSKYIKIDMEFMKRNFKNGVTCRNISDDEESDEDEIVEKMEVFLLCDTYCQKEIFLGMIQIVKKESWGFLKIIRSLLEIHQNHMKDGDFKCYIEKVLQGFFILNESQYEGIVDRTQTLISIKLLSALFIGILYQLVRMSSLSCSIFKDFFLRFKFILSAKDLGLTKLLFQELTKLIFDPKLKSAVRKTLKKKSDLKQMDERLEKFIDNPEYNKAMNILTTLFLCRCIDKDREIPKDEFIGEQPTYQCVYDAFGTMDQIVVEQRSESEKDVDISLEEIET